MQLNKIQTIEEFVQMTMSTDVLVFLLKRERNDSFPVAFIRVFSFDLSWGEWRRSIISAGRSICVSINAFRLNNEPKWR